MKLRIKGNDIRYRLTRSDIAKLASEGELAEYTEFAGQFFNYAVRIIAGTQLSGTFKQGTMTLLLPEKMLSEWQDTDRIGFEGSFDKLNLLIEKDFVCIDRPEENQQDYFPNPIAEDYEKRC